MVKTHRNKALDWLLWPILLIATLAQAYLMVSQVLDKIAHPPVPYRLLWLNGSGVYWKPNMPAFKPPPAKSVPETDLDQKREHTLGIGATWWSLLAYGVVLILVLDQEMLGNLGQSQENKGFFRRRRGLGLTTTLFWSVLAGIALAYQHWGLIEALPDYLWATLGTVLALSVYSHLRFLALSMLMPEVPAPSHVEGSEQ